MDNAVDKIKFQEPKYKKIILEYLKKQATRVSLSQITTGTALQTEWIEYILRGLMSEYPCEIIIQNHTAIYHFDFSGKRKGFFKNLEVILPILYFFFRIVWAIIIFAFLASYMFVGGLIFGLIACFNYPLIIVLTPIASQFIDIEAFHYKVLGYRNDILSSIFGHKVLTMDVFSSKEIISFLGAVKKDRLEIEKRLLDFISRNNGEMTIADMIQITGWTIRKSRTEATKLAGLYNGEIKVTEHGQIIYSFEGLQSKKQQPNYVSSVWAELLDHYQLCYLDISKFRRMLLDVLVYIVCSTSLVNILLVIIILNTRSSFRHYTGFMFFMSLPVIILITGYFLMFLRYLWYSYLNISVRNINLWKQIIEVLSKSKGNPIKVKDFLTHAIMEDMIVKCFHQLGGEARIDDQNEVYYFFEEFELSNQFKSIDFYKKVVLDEQFALNLWNRWSDKDSDEVSLKIDRGKYLCTHKREEGSWYTQIGMWMDSSKNYFKLETQIEFLKGDKNKAGYGLLWGKSDNENEYCFNISPSKKFCITKIENDAWDDIQSWTSSSSFNSSGANILTIEKHYQEFVFYINKEEVYRCASMPFFGSKIGFNLINLVSVSIEYLYMECEM